MERSGLTTGVALYEDLKALRRLWAGDRGDEDHARQSVATTVTFGEEWDIPVADLEAAKKHGWQVARLNGLGRCASWSLLVTAVITAIAGGSTSGAAW